MSAAGLKDEVELALKEIRSEHLDREGHLRNYLFDYLEKDTARTMEQVRLGLKKASADSKKGK